MGGLFSNPKIGDVIESKVEVSSGFGSGRKQYAVVINDMKVITKDEHGLRVDELKSKIWSNSTIIEKAGNNCANHAIKRFQKGEVINDTRRKDIRAYNGFTANSQHFVNDCINQMDPEEDPQEVKNGGSDGLGWLSIGVLTLGAAGLFLASNMKSSESKSTNGETTNSNLNMSKSGQFKNFFPKKEPFAIQFK